MKRKSLGHGRNGSERQWLSKLRDWVGEAVVGALLGSLVAWYFYHLGAAASAAQERHLEAVIKDAERRGIVSAKYNSQGKVISLGLPLPVKNLRAE